MKKAIVFKVTGRGQFPVDMLRYDQCWPRGGEDAVKLLTHYTDGHYGEPRSVVLMGYIHPTVDRWRSFGWGCQEV